MLSGSMGLIGKCQHCGACCKWETAKGLEMFKDRRDEKREWCPHYLKEIKRCGIYDTRPEGCRLFPRIAEHLLDGCGFSFTNKQDTP